MEISLNSIIAPVSAEMNKFEDFFKKTLESESPLLKDILQYLLDQKGKRIRPLLVFLSAAATGKTIINDTFVSASAIEMLHTATIVHDDVVDDSDERRGKKSIKAIWHSKAAVLVGDYLLAQALLLITKHKLYDLLDIMTIPICEMSEGELLQIEKSLKLDISEVVYFDIIRKKTASLLASAMATGAKSVGASQQLTDTMHAIGENIGIAFQIKDDIFDFQKTNLLGKPTGNDLVEKKMTLPLIYALKKVSEKEQKEVVSWVSLAEKDRKYINKIRDFVLANNGIAFAENTALEYSNKAILLLNNLNPSAAQKALVELANFAVQRKK